MRAKASYRDAVLREMGLAPLWRLRTTATAGLVEDPPAEHCPPESAAHLQPQAMASAAVPHVAAGATAARDRLRVPQPGLPPLPVPEEAAGEQPGHGERERCIAALDWSELEAEIHGCRACVLCEQRRQAVVGVGDLNPQWMFVGEGPGREEDLRGEPFVGQAGRLLDSMLAALGLERSQRVYIANAVKCRPPHNRIPQAQEIAACRPFLQRQIELLRPALLFALGRPAAQALLDEEISISAARGKVFDYRGIPLVISYHPAYLLRNPQDKGKAWADLCFARQVLAGRNG